MKKPQRLSSGSGCRNCQLKKSQVNPVASSCQACSCHYPKSAKNQQSRKSSKEKSSSKSRNRKQQQQNQHQQQENVQVFQHSYPLTTTAPASGGPYIQQPHFATLNYDHRLATSSQVSTDQMPVITNIKIHPFTTTHSARVSYENPPTTFSNQVTIPQQQYFSQSRLPQHQSVQQTNLIDPHFTNNHGQMFSPVGQSPIRSPQMPFTSQNQYYPQSAFTQQPTPSSAFRQSVSPMRGDRGSNYHTAGQDLPLQQQQQFSPSKSIQSHYDQVLQEFDLYNRERFMNLREGISKIQSSMKTDEIILAMREDPSTQHFAFQRMKEVIDNALIVELEQSLSALRTDNVILKERTLYLEAELVNSRQNITQLAQTAKDSQPQNPQQTNQLEKRIKKLQQRKEYYKQQVLEANDQVQQLIEKLKEFEGDNQKQHEDFEVKLAQKDGELARCEKVLSEVRSMLSERTMNDNRLQNNLSNEVTSLHERVQSLEKEKLDLVDKYSRYGEEFKSLLSKEQDQFQQKVVTLKGKIKDLQDKSENSENKAKELESQARCYVKEIEDQRLRIDELVKQSQERGFQLQDVQEKHKTAEKDYSHKMRSEKSKSKSKILQLQSKFEQVMQEKLQEIEEECRNKVLMLEQEKQDLEYKLKSLSEKVQQQEEETKQALIVQQKQFEKKIDKLTLKFEQEIQTKLQESEQTFKDLELKLKKDFKKEKKTLLEQIQLKGEEHQTELQNQEDRFQREFNEMSLKLRGDLDRWQKECQDLRIKLSEVTLQRDHVKEQNEVIYREKEQLNVYQKEQEQRFREDIKALEDQIKSKTEENDIKVRQALDEAIKHHNIESLAQQYAQELEKKTHEAKMERDTKNVMAQKLEKSREEIEKMRQNVAVLKQLLDEKELVLQRTIIVNKENLAKIQHFVKISLDKYKSENDYLKRQFLSELEMNKKQQESQLQAIQSKARELLVTQKFKLEKIQYVYEQKFETEFSKREIEWEKAWEKREEHIVSKEKQIKDIEYEKHKIQDTLTRTEMELNQVKSKVESYKKHIDDLNNKVKQGEHKCEEITKTFKQQEDQIQVNYRQQIQEQKLILHNKSQDDLKRLEQQMNEYREKSKKKINDISQHLEKTQSKHRQEIQQIKQVYEEKINQLETDKEQQSKVIYESKNVISVFEIKSQTIEKEKQRLEGDLQEYKSKEKTLISKIDEVQEKYNELEKENDLANQIKDQLEKEFNSLKESNYYIQTQLQQAHQQVFEQRKKLKDATKKLNHSKRREEKEVQILNDMLTKSIVGSARKPSTSHTKTTSIVTSPDFQKNRQNGNQLGGGMYQGFISARNSSRTRAGQQPFASGNYQTIMSEINSMIDNNIALRQSEQKPNVPRSILKNRNNFSSPTMTTLGTNLNSNNAYQSKNYSQQVVQIDLKENPLSIQDLKYQ